jgi:PAS domain S-box-containing protein
MTPLEGMPGRPVVLVVDDEPLSRMLVSEALTLSGFAVVEANDGASALTLFDIHRPDLVFMDAVMPGIDGFQACQKVRDLPGGLDIPILMLTGLDDVDSIAHAFESGATDFATKLTPWPVLAQRARYMLRARWTLEALRRSEARLSSAQRIARLGHWEQDLRTSEFHWSDQLSQLFGFPLGMVVKDLEVIRDRIDPADREAVQAARERLGEEATYQVDFRVLWPDGTVRHMHEHAEAVSDEQGQRTRIVGTVQDITERKEAEERARFLAHYDELTGLANRRLLVEQLRLALARARRGMRGVAILFVDLDRFKRINDTLGHTTGDRILQAVAESLRACVRESDPVGRVGSPGQERERDAIARFGGDEFVLVLGDLNQDIDADTAARRILRRLREPITVDGHEIVATASIGISLFPNDGQDAETLLRNADAAMYHAKEQGRNGLQFYDRSMNERAVDRLLLENELRRALDQEQFVLYFQPQVHSRTGLISGAEALIRWRHPTRGLLSPQAFIPLAEETGLIVPIGEWVIRAACSQARAWSEAGLGPLPVSVNLSGRQFKLGAVTQIVERAIIGLSPALLELEITESVLMEGSKDAVDMLKALRAHGIRIAVDDFGTGYSSLSYLKRLPIDRLKIDRSFVRDVLTDPDDAALSEAIIVMARALRLETVAEGVESQAQADLLRDLGCHYLQGYLFGRPVAAEAFAQSHVLVGTPLPQGSI